MNRQLATLKDSRLIILGLGRAGRAATRFLLKVGARVAGYDDNTRVWVTPQVKSLLQQGLKMARITTLKSSNLAHLTVIASPGFPSNHRVIRFFEERGVLVLDELDFASQFLPGRLIAVTGTNGKSTTVALIASILKEAGSKVFMGGNLAPGKPLGLALLGTPRDFYVIEVSSFQLERAHFIAPKVAVILNITQDHLDRHRTFAHYVRCKARILERQSAEDWAVLNYDDPVVREMRNLAQAKRLFFSLKRRVNGGYLHNNSFFFQGSAIASTSTLASVRTSPIVDNALAAITVARILGVGRAAIIRALRKFRGLEHRLEPVACIRQVKYINNSMCTNPMAGIRSLEAFPKRVILIAGGKEKNVLILDYLKAIKRRAKWVVLLGENSERLADGLQGLGFFSFEIACSMRAAVRAASRRANPGDIILFSPGFASFDMFRDFQDRGKAFKNEVKRL
ncbi:MAG: UDP-N-acetylmuramoyl-L-alanine--D-glutamate ligase [bacterium]